MVSGASCWQLGQVIVDCKIIPRCFRFELVSLLGLANRIHHPAKRPMLPVLDLDPAIEGRRDRGDGGASTPDPPALSGIRMQTDPARSRPARRAPSSTWSRTENEAPIAVLHRACVHWVQLGEACDIVRVYLHRLGKYDPVDRLTARRCRE
jgi:hypothetical protein